ncbi:MAG: hypothetical protein JHC95_19315 [Solirubrobacteraceae bacterium]|nr:hypothetical protein [Solirubrobacteraceae bacterium]
MRHRRLLRLLIPAVVALLLGMGAGAASAKDDLTPATPVVGRSLADVVRSVPLPRVVRERAPIARLTTPQPTRALILAELRATEARRAEAERLARTRTVPGALRRALLLRKIDQAQHDADRRTWYRATQTERKLRGARGRELHAVLDQVRSLAARRMLGPSRINAAMLSVRRNVAVWAMRPFPRAGADVVFPRDDRVYRYIPGQGVQMHALASFGAANALARRCISEPSKCRRRKLRRLLTDLIAVSSWRGGFRAWEYQYRFGTGRPPWVSGMAQGTAVQAFARSAKALGDRSFLDISRSALGAFETPTPVGVARGNAYVMYSFDPGQRILNGELQAVAGLHDLFVLSGDKRAERLYDAGERAVRSTVSRYDTGSWSLYSLGGQEANLHYHQFTTVQLRGLCRRTKQGAYCRAKHRFRAYQREAPVVRIGVIGGARPHRVVRIGFSTSKVGRVWIRVDGPGGRSLDRTLQLPRGRHSVLWSPPRKGRYTVRVDARGLSGPAGRIAQTVRVTAPKKAKRRK